MAGKRCGAFWRSHDRWTCVRPAGHDGGCQGPPTARERRLLRLLKRARKAAQHLAEHYDGPQDRALLAAIDREIDKGVKRGK